AVATNLGTALLSRAVRDDSAADLDRGIALAEAAIKATAPNSAALAARYDTAGRLRAHRGRPEDLTAAEGHAEAAVAATPAGSNDQALYLNNWARWATDRWELTGSVEHLTRAVDLLERALAVTDSNDTVTVLAATIMYNLGARFQEMFEFRLSEDGHEDLDLLQRAADLLDNVLAADYPHLSVVAGKRLGDIAWRIEFWKEGEHAFRLAMSAAGRLAGLRRQRQDKERARSGVQGIGALAALCAARTGDNGATAVHLEQASATLIAEAIGITAETVTLDGIVAGAARMDRHVLMLGVTLVGGIAAVVSPDGSVRSRELPELTEPAVDDHVEAFRQAMLDAETDPDVDPVGAVETLVDWTTAALLEPVAPLLDGIARLAVLPLGRLAWLPITTASRRGREAVLAPFTPLLLVRTTPTRDQVVHDGSRRTVVWADTGPVGNPIPGVVREAKQVAEYHPGAEVRIRDGSTTEEEPVDPTGPDRLRTLLDADLVHLACHCEVDVNRPQDTVLHVSPPIRIGVEFGVGRHGRAHVVLSACEAALTGAALPDEALSVATAFLLAGAGVVTAPLWPVGDGVAPVFMPEYHAALASGADPAAALVAVQRSWAAWPRIAHAPWVVTAWPDAVPA
ncbi:MAG: CHAT domain-containing protein, partial [Pseudonocardiaceae bacterium]